MVFKLSKTIKGILLNKVFDLLIVVVGVSIAFQLNNLKQHSDQQSLEQFYLKSLGEDVAKDVKKVNEILLELKADLTAAEDCLQNNIEITRLEPAVMKILSFETFNDRNENTYRTLINGGGLTAINDQQLRSSITEYYQGYGNIDRFESVYTEFLLNHFNTYFSPHYSYATQKLTDITILKDIQTKNNWVIVKSQLSEGIEAYEEVLEKAIRLSKALNSKQ